jgi:hypothetical protein
MGAHNPTALFLYTDLITSYQYVQLSHVSSIDLFLLPQPSPLFNTLTFVFCID